MSSIQSFIGSAFSNYAVGWHESPESIRSQHSTERIPEKPVEKTSPDPDRGKPRSASGDVLDLSSNTKARSERSEENAKTDVSPKFNAEDAVMASLVQTQPKTGTEFSPSSAYEAQSVSSSTSSRFSAYA